MSEEGEKKVKSEKTIMFITVGRKRADEAVLKREDTSTSS